MNLHSLFQRSTLMIASMAVLVLATGCVTTQSTQTSQTSTAVPYRTPLEGKEVVERLRGGAKQAELGQEVRQRGIVNVTAADMDSLKSAGASAELMDAILTSLAKGPPPAQHSTTVIYRDTYPWVWAAYPWWAPRLGLNWSWHYRRR